MESMETELAEWGNTEIQNEILSARPQHLNALYGARRATGKGKKKGKRYHPVR